MVKIKRFGAAVLATVTMCVANSYAELPTLDAGNMAASGSIVKNGTENISLIDKINGKVSELNTIVGDGAASVAKFQADYGDDIQKGIEIAQKAMARAQEAKAAKEEHDAEVQAQKDAYQAAMDSLEDNQSTEEAEENLDMATEEEMSEETAQREQIISGEFSALEKEAENSSLMTSANKYYDDEADTENNTEMRVMPQQADTSEEFIDGVPDTQAQVTRLQPMTSGTLNVSGSISRENAVVSPNLKATSSVGATTAPVLKKIVAPSVTENNSTSAVSTSNGAAANGTVLQQNNISTSLEENGAATPNVQRKKFRVSPSLQKIEKVSSSHYRHSEKIALASAEESSSVVGNSYIGDVYVVPMSQMCEIKPESFIEDENVRKDCIEKIIRENNADNSFDSAMSMKDCRKMIYNTVVALLAEATQSKYEAANYSDTLDKQDELAGDSTDVRGDITVIAMSNQQTQLLLNRLSMSFSSQIILETAEQLCALQKDVLGDSDLDEDSETDGEK